MVYMLLGTGFEETEAVTPLDILRRAGIPVTTVGINGKTITGSHKINLEADITLGEIDLTDAEMVIIPGGLGGVASLRACPEALAVLQFAWDNGKYLAAICAGPTVLADLHITDNSKVTCYPGQEANMGTALIQENAASVIDGRLITGTSAGCAIPFGLAIVSVLKGQETADTIAKQLVIR